MPQRNGKNPIRTSRVFGQSFGKSFETPGQHKTSG